MIDLTKKEEPFIEENLTKARTLYVLSRTCQWVGFFDTVTINTLFWQGEKGEIKNANMLCEHLNEAQRTN